jgi:hypothetical protein
MYMKIHRRTETEGNIYTDTDDDDDDDDDDAYSQTLDRRLGQKRSGHRRGRFLSLSGVGPQLLACRQSLYRLAFTHI